MNPETAMRALVNEFFHDRPHLIEIWWSTENPMLGGIRPDDMIKIPGRAEKMLKIFKNMQEGNMP